MYSKVLLACSHLMHLLQAATKLGVLNLQMEAVLRGGQSSREGELCVQAVFTLLDTLRTWLAEQRGIASSSGAAGIRCACHTGCSSA